MTNNNNIHIIHTRFNANKFNSIYRVKQPGLNLNNSWLDYRFEIFKTFTLKSINNQVKTSDKLEWILLFDRNTDDKFLKNFDHYMSNECSIKYKILYNRADLYIKSLLQKEDAIIITRLDSDDLICSDYFKCIYNSVSRSNNNYYFINFDKGICIDLKDNIYVKRKLPSNMFITEVYRKDICDDNRPNIFKYKHNEINGKFNIIHMNKEFSYIILSSYGNVLNSILKSEKCDVRDIKELKSYDIYSMYGVKVEEFESFPPFNSRD